MELSLPLRASRIGVYSNGFHASLFVPVVQYGNCYLLVLVNFYKEYVFHTV